MAHQPVSSDHAEDRTGTWRDAVCRRPLIQGSLRAVGVEVLDLLVQHDVEVVWAGDQEVVEAFPAQGVDEAFARGLASDADDADLSTDEDGIERGGEPAAESAPGWSGRRLPRPPTTPRRAATRAGARRPSSAPPMQASWRGDAGIDRWPSGSVSVGPLLAHELTAPAQEGVQGDQAPVVSRQPCARTSCYSEGVILIH
jgi:hypothetical protein